MAIRKGKAPARGAKAKAKAPEAEAEAVEQAAGGATAKLTISVKRRLSTGDEVFIAPGIEMACSADDLEATQEAVTSRVNGWMEELLAQYPDADPLDEEDEDEDEGDEEDEDEDEEDEDEDEDALTEADVKKMKKAELVALAEEYEIELESSKVAEMREELIEALFEEDAEEGDEDEDEDEDEEDGDEEGYTEDELSAMKLEQLQEICDEWELDHPELKRNAKLAAKKKAYIETILEAQDEE